MSSSSDFSSDEEEEHDASLAPHVVAVEPLADEEHDDPEMDGAALLTTLRDAAVPDALLQALAPVLDAQQQSYSYDAHTAALYFLTTLWPEDAPAATQRALAAARVAVFRRFQRAFPLTPELYREFVAAEDAAPRKLALYEQATGDYWDVALALDHLTLLAESQDELPGVDWGVVERAIERALATVGTHFTAGHDVWKTARELTAQHWEDDDAAKEAALRALFARQMRLPLQQNDLAMSELRAWLQYNTLAPAAARDAALREAERFQQRVFGGAVYKKLNHFEARLAAALAGTPLQDAAETEAPERVWTQYLRYTQFKLAPLLATPEDADRYVAGLFERAVASVCLSSSLWSQYVEYVRTTNPPALLAVAQRATRNVSFDSAFWVERLLAMEAAAESDTGVAGKLERIHKMVESDLMTRTAPPLMDSVHTARVLNSYCGVVRRLSENAGDAVDAAIARCERYLETAFGAADESALAALRTFQAQFYAFQLSSAAADGEEEDELLAAKWRETWVEILRIRGAQAEAWLSFYDEFRFTHASSPTLVQDLRDEVFSGAVQQVQDYPLLVLERWLAFEEGVGDRDAYASVRARYQREMQRITQQASTHAVVGVAETPAAAVVVTNEKSASKKRKPESGAPAAAPAKRQKPTTTTGPPAAASEPAKKTERFTNDHTLFVCNVPKEATQDELRALFAFVPTLQDVRLVVKERGSHVKSRGMAYVQFRDDAGVTAGLAVDGTELHGQRIKVERSTPPSGGKNTNTNATKAGTRSADDDSKGPKATTTVYVGGLLPPEKEPITEEQLKTALVEVLGGDAAAVKQVLILTDRRGRPKDYGLVEMADTALVGAAVKKQHELQLQLGGQVTVKTSRMTIQQVVRHRDEQKQATQQAKEAKQAQQPATSERTPKPSSGFQAKTAPHSKPHARVAAPLKSAASLMPRALRKKTATSTAEAGAPPANEHAVAPKTNDDFRKLFLS